MDEIVKDNDALISRVEAGPVMWDKTLYTFKDRNATRDAWRLVCCKLKKDFEETHTVSSMLYVIYTLLIIYNIMFTILIIQYNANKKYLL